MNDEDEEDTTLTIPTLINLFILGSYLNKIILHHACSLVVGGYGYH